MEFEIMNRIEVNNITKLNVSLYYIEHIILSENRYDARLKDPLTGKERKVRFKNVHKMLGLVTYLDWVMIFITGATCISMMFETPK